MTAPAAMSVYDSPTASRARAPARPQLEAQPRRGRTPGLIPPQADLSDAELVARARAGERWSQTMLCRRHWRVIYAAAARLAGRDDAEDVTQEAFADAFGSLDRLREPSAFRAWVYCMCVRLARRHYRRRARLRLFVETTAVTIAAPSWDTGTSAELALELKEFSACVARLTANGKAALMLRLEGNTHCETAEALGKSLSSVKRWLAQVDRRLAKQGNLPATIAAYI